MRKQQINTREKLRKEGHLTTRQEGHWTPRVQHSKDLIKRSGEALSGIGETYKGFAVIHYYEIGEEEVVFKSLADVGDLHEVPASLGLNELRDKLKGIFRG
jgi:hypothetical protein